MTDTRGADLTIAGATVRIESGPQSGQTEITDTDGRYRFENVAGTITVTVTGNSGYPDRTIKVTMDTDRTVDFVLEHSGRPPFTGTVWITPNILGPSDLSSLQGATYAGRAVRAFWDRPAEAWVMLNVYLFDVQFVGQQTEFQVHPAFGNREAAKSQVDTYAPALGRLPAVLLSQVREVEISEVEGVFQGNETGILHIYTPHGDELTRNGFLEEVLIHEAGHASLDRRHRNATGWVAAQRADSVFISTYARDNPEREDVAESILPYFAVRYRSDRLSETDRSAITTAIPHRLRYFDEQGFDMSPYAETQSIAPVTD